MIVWAALGLIDYESVDLIGIAHSRANAVKMCRDNPAPKDAGPDAVYSGQWVQRWLLGSTTCHGDREAL